MEKEAVRSIKCLIHRKYNKNYGKILAYLSMRLKGHLSDYQQHFRNRTKNNFSKAEKYTE